MTKAILIIGICLGLYTFSQAQNRSDSIKLKQLKEVTVTGKTGLDSINESKPLSGIDEYIQKLPKVSPIKRGGYAWEATVNNMATERISVTLDGMKIFCACTDKMDPVTSYVEIQNLDNIQVGSGLSGNLHGANSIGGGLDLKLQKAGFHSQKLSLTLNSAYETNGNYKVLGAGLAYSSPSFYVNTGAFYRKSDDYVAGNNEKVDFSQFEKVNVFSNAGYKLANNKILEGTVIYDVATDVGYPALTMDVKTAKGLITSVSYRQNDISNTFSSWESKLYYNNITHIMDDTKRPDVPVHMDMPGKSRTGGYYSTLKGRKGKHNFVLSQDTYYNQSLASMTMYPINKTEVPMFMYTWPDIRTLNAAVYAEDNYVINIKNTVQLSTRLSSQWDGLHSDFGYRTLKMYYPDMTQYQNRLLGDVSAKYTHYMKDMQLKIGGGYGSRAPSPTEAYGFYLYNSFDNYDNIGNPKLKNESAAEANIAFTVTKPNYSITWDASYFYFSNYIIAKPDSSFSTMTYGAKGVMVYRNLSHASIFNTGVEAKVLFLKNFHWTSHLAYSLGQENNRNPLPLIAPFSYSTSVRYLNKKFSSGVELQGATKQYKYSPEYGEDETPAYYILNASAGYDISLKHNIVNIKTGVENIFDRRYSTYADWNNIPRKGRNVFLSLTIHVL
jgi:iron complex outermembrane receptor protein